MLSNTIQRKSYCPPLQEIASTHCGWFRLQSLPRADLLVLLANHIKHGERGIKVPAAGLLAGLATRDTLSLIAGMLNDKHYGVRQAATVILVKLATDVDAEGLLDLVAEKSQGWDEIALSHYQALCLLDQKFYCHITPQEQT